MDNLSVGVVVPTLNSARTLQHCLQSLQAQLHRPVVVVVDNQSTDGTLEIARRFADIVETAGPERSAQRNRGATLLERVDIVGFIDSDMVLDPDVVAQVVAVVRHGAGAVVVPEHTFGEGWVARVREYERAQYIGCSKVEAPRFFTSEHWRSLGGFDESLNAGEDWDLALRARAQEISMASIEAPIWHDEGSVGYIAHCRKKGRYAGGMAGFTSKHGREARQVLLDRPYLRRPWKLLRHPLLSAGMLVLKAGELAAVAVALAVHARRLPLHDRIKQGTP